MFYKPVQSERFFEKTRKYAEINWDYFPGVVDAFDRRIRGWYVEPIEVLLERGVDDSVRKMIRSLAKRENAGHYSFAITAMTCLLIDMLSQYVGGKLKSDKSDFKGFVRRHLPCYCATVEPEIKTAKEPLRDVADVLYHGFRCGILHQAHAPLYCGIVPGNTPPTIELTNHAKYADGEEGDCPVVVIRPEHLFDELMAFYVTYVKNLKDKSSTHDALRNTFKKKFADSFGIDIDQSIL